MCPDLYFYVFASLSFCNLCSFVLLPFCLLLLSQTASFQATKSHMCPDLYFYVFFVFLSSLLCIFVFLTFLLLLFSQTANFKATKAYLCAPGDFLPFEVLMEQSFETCLKSQRAIFYVMTFINFASIWCC